jgi:hypothetical protein
MFIALLFYFVLWLAITLGAGEVLVDLTREMRGVATTAHQRGPISHSLFTRQLTTKQNFQKYQNN